MYLIINLSVNFWTNKMVDDFILFFGLFSLKTTAKCFECQILTSGVDLLLPLSWDCEYWRWAFLSFVTCYKWKLLANVYIYWGKSISDWNSINFKWKCAFIAFPSPFLVLDLDQMALWLHSSEVVNWLLDVFMHLSLHCSKWICSDGLCFCSVRTLGESGKCVMKP